MKTYTDNLRYITHCVTFTNREQFDKGIVMLMLMGYTINVERYSVSSIEKLWENAKIHHCNILVGRARNGFIDVICHKNSPVTEYIDIKI